jgi:hypothetical protein
LVNITCQYHTLSSELTRDALTWCLWQEAKEEVLEAVGGQNNDENKEEEDMHEHKEDEDEMVPRKIGVHVSLKDGDYMGIDLMCLRQGDEVVDLLARHGTPLPPLPVELPYARCQSSDEEYYMSDPHDEGSDEEG